MYITINDIIGSKTIDLSYPIQGKEALALAPRPVVGAHWQSPATWSVEAAVVRMLSDNVQYWLQGPIEVLLKAIKKLVLNKGIKR